MAFFWTYVLEWPWITLMSNQNQKFLELFLKILISLIIDVKTKLRIVTENMQSIQPYNFPQNRFNGLWSSQRHSDSVGVNNCHNFTDGIFSVLMKNGTGTRPEFSSMEILNIPKIWDIEYFFKILSLWDPVDYLSPISGF